jgi:hypothetical protein
VAATITTIKDRIEKMAGASGNFNDSVLEVTSILCFVTAVLVPFNHLPESWKKAQFFNGWENLQVVSCHNFILYPIFLFVCTSKAEQLRREFQIMSLL